jgi:hypothetical protein
LISCFTASWTAVLASASTTSGLLSLEEGLCAEHQPGQRERSGRTDVGARPEGVDLGQREHTGDLALKTTETEVLLPSKKSPAMLLQTLIDNGATSVRVCPAGNGNQSRS